MYLVNQTLSSWTVSTRATWSECGSERLLGRFHSLQHCTRAEITNWRLEVEYWIIAKHVYRRIPHKLTSLQSPGVERCQKQSWLAPADGAHHQTESLWLLKINKQPIWLRMFNFFLCCVFFVSVYQWFQTHQYFFLFLSIFSWKQGCIRTKTVKASVRQ